MNLWNFKNIDKRLLKENILKEFGCLDKQQLNIEDKKTLDRCEMPVTHEKCPRIDINSYKAHINSRLPDVLKVIFEEDFLWHFPPQVRRLSIEKEIGLLPFHQDYYYNANYENIMVCWTPLSKCGENAPSLDLVNKTIKEKIEHKSNEIWEFGISPEIFNKYASEDEIISLTDVNIGDVVIFDAYNLHRTYRNENMNQIRYSMDLRCIEINFIKSLEINNALVDSLCGDPSKIIYIGSSASLHAKASPCYTLSKSLINTYVKNISSFYIDKNVSICAILPGILGHKGSEWDKKKKEESEKYYDVMKKQPLKRFIMPEDISPYIIDLISNESFLHTGSIIKLDANSY